jgi:hypothetical protein
MTTTTALALVLSGRRRAAPGAVLGAVLGAQMAGGDEKERAASIARSGQGADKQTCALRT